MAKDPEAAFFKSLEGLQPCEVSELKAGTHIFAVYGLNLDFLIHLSNFVLFRVNCFFNIFRVYPGDNFFKTAAYTIETQCTKDYAETTEKTERYRSSNFEKEK